MTTASTDTPRAGWSRARPETIPRSTYWPAAMAFGITFMFWGLITSPVVLIAGTVAFVVALAGWIGDLRREHEVTK